MKVCKTTRDGQEGAGMEVAPDITKLIPDEERAVTVQAQEGIHVEIQSVIEPIGDMSGQVLAEERAEAGQLPAELAAASACGCFNPVLGFKGFKLSCGGAIFAKVCTSPKSGRFVEFRQMYLNGAYSGKMQIKQSHLFEAYIGSFGMKKTGDAVLDKRIRKFVLEVREDYFSKLEYPAESIDVVCILATLMTVYRELPKEDGGATILENPQKFYAAVIKTIEQKMPMLMDGHRSYYTLFNDDIRALADALDVKRTQLLKKLKEYKFLYLTESSEGYQTCVRFKPDGEFINTYSSEWCYCILKLGYLAERKKLQDGSISQN